MPKLRPPSLSAITTIALGVISVAANATYAIEHSAGNWTLSTIIPVVAVSLPPILMYVGHHAVATGRMPRIISKLLRTFRFSPYVLLVVLCAAAFWTSFEHQRALLVDHGITGSSSIIIPINIDVMMVTLMIVEAMNKAHDKQQKETHHDQPLSEPVPDPRTNHVGENRSSENDLPHSATPRPADSAHETRSADHVRSRDDGRPASSDLPANRRSEERTPIRRSDTGIDQASSSASPRLRSGPRTHGSSSATSEHEPIRNGRPTQRPRRTDRANNADPVAERIEQIKAHPELSNPTVAKVQATLGGSNALNRAAVRQLKAMQEDAATVQAQAAPSPQPLVNA